MSLSPLSGTEGTQGRARGGESGAPAEMWERPAGSHPGPLAGAPSEGELLTSGAHPEPIRSPSPAGGWGAVRRGEEDDKG